MGKFLFHLYNHRRIILIILFAVSLAWFASAYANILILRTRLACSEETGYEFSIAWEDGDDEANTNGTEVWDGETGSVTYNDGTSSVSCGSSVTFDTYNEFLCEGSSCGGSDENDAVAYQRAVFKIPTGLDNNGEYQGIFGYFRSGGTIRGYLQLYYNTDHNEIRCRFIEDAGSPTWDCGDTTSYNLNTSNCYQAEVYWDTTTPAVGWRMYEQTGCSGAWSQVIGAGGAFDSNSANMSGASFDEVDEHFVGEHRDVNTCGYTLELDNYVYHTSAIGLMP